MSHSGATNASFSYTPFGTLLEASEGISGEIASHHRRHNDKTTDPISRLAYYGVRYYDRALLGWTQADPKYLVSPDAVQDSPRRALLYTMALNNPLRYLDPDGRDPKPLRIFIRPLTGEAFGDLTNEIIEDIREDYQASGYTTAGGFGRLIQRYGNMTPQFLPTPPPGVVLKDTMHLEILLVNMNDGKSIDAAIKLGYDKAARERIADSIDSMRNDSNEVGRTGIGDHIIIIAVDRIAAKEKAAGVNGKSKEDRAARKKFHQHTGAHEGGHAFNLCHNDTKGQCRAKERDNRDRKQMMHGRTTLSSDMFRWWSTNDIDKAAAASSRF